MKRFELYYIFLCLLLLTGCLCSCMEEKFTATIDGNEQDDSEKDMYLRVTVPRSYATSAVTDKETQIETLDVLVFGPGKVDPDNFYVRAACIGTRAADGKFQVIMPVGENFTVHVFANCHDDLVAESFYNSAGTEMGVMLSRLATNIDLNGDATESLPMHGYRTGIDIDKDKANTTLSIPVLRSVAAAQVTTDATVNPDNTLTPGTLTNFELRELYAFFQPHGGRVAADAANYETLAPGADNLTRDVTAVTLPDGHSCEGVDGNIFIKEAAPVNQIGNLYLYENKPYSDTGFDQPDDTQPAATTRLVVGGVYDGEKMPDGITPKVTYYRVDFTDADSKLTSLLRNHLYTFNIRSVSGSGYDTPEEAATGVPINIYVQLIDWVNEMNNVDFDRENYFYAETKTITLPRDAGSVRSIEVESDVAVDDWGMSFATTANGATTPVTVEAGTGKVTPTTGASLSNARYKVEKSADGKKLTVTALKAWSNLTGSETYGETLLIKIKNLTVRITLIQKDRSPDDWGDGGEQGTELGTL